MDRLRTSLALTCGGGLLFTTILLGQSAPEGFFSATQANHGDIVFREKCAACHRSDLAGGDEAPALKGNSFWSEWDQQTARSLYSRIISTMPPDSPGSLDEKDVIDIVAFVVHENGLPVGSKAVESPNELNGIKLQRPK
jgi:S-disulfanyl-L-cysteine oxidoreductase SoxD